MNSKTIVSGLSPLPRISPRDRMNSEEVLERCKLEDIKMVLRQKRLSWFGHVKQRNEDDTLSRIQKVVAPRRRPTGKPKKTWHDCVNQDLLET